MSEVLHEYIPQLSWLGNGDTGVSANCSCGWRSAYTHAYEKYALEDFKFHLENPEPEREQ